MRLAACYCTYQVDRDGAVFRGLAVTTRHGNSSVITIMPEHAESGEDALKVEDLYDYTLDWTASLYPRG